MHPDSSPAEFHVIPLFLSRKRGNRRHENRRRNTAGWTSSSGKNNAQWLVVRAVIHERNPRSVHQLHPNNRDPRVSLLDLRVKTRAASPNAVSIARQGKGDQCSLCSAESPARLKQH